MTQFKYGRRERGVDPRVPHYSAMRFKLKTSAPPTSVDYNAGMPADLGMMLNNRLGCCAEAGYFHAVQTWTFAATGKMLTVPDSCVEELYATQGYVPGNPATDRGTVLQSLLQLLVSRGARMPDGTYHKILGYMELDPRNVDDVDLATAEGALVYLGFSVPAYFEAAGFDSPGSTWAVVPDGDTRSVGGHCVNTARYGKNGVRGIESWGSYWYSMTPGFWAGQVDEAYAIVDPLFIKATGKTPFGMTEADWAAAMRALVESAP